MPASVIRDQFRQAGVHIYTDSGDPFTANESFLSIHTATAGRKTISLPSAHPVYDIVSERLISPMATKFTIDIPTHKTRIYYLGKP